MYPREFSGEPSSALVERIFAEESSQRMPPAKTNKKLTAAQKELLKRWIASGAEYQVHWSYIAPARPKVKRIGFVSRGKRWQRQARISMRCRSRVEAPSLLSFSPAHYSSD